MAMRIRQCRRKRRRARSASRPCPRWWRSSSSWASRWPCRAARATRRTSSDDAYRAAGAEVVGDGRRTLGRRSDIVFKVRAPSPEEVGLMREGATLIGFIWPAQNPELMQQLAARKATVLAIDCAAAPALARPEDGRADLDGRHQRLPRGDRGGQRVRPLLQRPDHRRGQDPAGQGLHRRRRRRRPGRDRHGRRAWARSCAPTTRAPRSPTRSCRSAASSSRSTTRKKAPAAAATPR